MEFFSPEWLERRRTLEKNILGERIADSRYIRRVNALRELRESPRDKLEFFLNSSNIDELITGAKDAFELIQEKTNGVFIFKPKLRVLYNERVSVLNPEDPRGAVLDYNVLSRSGESLSWILYASSEIETEISCRLAFSFPKPQVPSKGIKVLGNELSVSDLQKCFSSHYRDLAGIFPVRVESAFNYALNLPIKVEGIDSPVNLSSIIYKK